MIHRDLFKGNRNGVKLCLVMFVIGCFSMMGCQSSGDNHSDVQVDWEITPSPPSVGQATLEITLRDSTNELLTNADVNIEGNMSHPGMQPVIAEAKEVEPGVYSAPIEFSMGGDWFFIVESTLPDNRVIERQIDVPGVSSQE